MDKFADALLSVSSSICTPEGIYCLDITCAVHGGWTPWSPWSDCPVTCGGNVHIRTRACINPPPRNQGLPCGGPDSQTQNCSTQSCPESICNPPFEFRACGSPCDSHCSTRKRPELCKDIPRCLPGCYCPQGLLEQRGSCVPPAQCACLHPHQATGPVFVAAGEAVLIGCKKCVCQAGELQCSSQDCQGLLPLSDWSPWTACSDCLPLAALGPGVLPALLEQAEAWWLSPPVQVSVRHRYRLCLDPQTGQPWMGPDGVCTAELDQRRVCPDETGACQDFCLWSEWGVWSPCRTPCSGGFRLRRRLTLHPDAELRCKGLRYQSETCNAAPCPGETCEDRGKVYDANCANGCPRTCLDFWEHVECLQGQCREGCRCPEGQLLQDGACVPIHTCQNGSFTCPEEKCPSYGEWSTWSPCSATCGGGATLRHRTCHESLHGAPCEAESMEEGARCNSQPCPAGCLLSDWTVWSPCSASCGGGVSERHRRPLSPPGDPCPSPLLQHRLCHTQNCTPGEPLHLVGKRNWGQSLYPPTALPSQNALGLRSTTTVPTPARTPAQTCAWKLSVCKRNAGPAASAHLASVCRRGVFACTQESCDACPEGEQRPPAHLPSPCERNCRQIYKDLPQNCSSGVLTREGCTCQPGYYRNGSGHCVVAAHCECEEGGQVYSVSKRLEGDCYTAGAEWTQGCEVCRCVNGRALCEARCPPLVCLEGEGKVQDPGSCCPVCRKESLGCYTLSFAPAAEPHPHCRHFTERRNITKGSCFLGGVEVGFCKGQCASHTNVIPE
ncbi:hypothetical protein Chor_010808, partial [Crotalus horridus]